MKFSEKLAARTATIVDFNTAIDEWHDAHSGKTVFEYLGISESQYAMLLKDPESIKKLYGTYPVAGSFIKKVLNKMGGG